MINQEFKSLDKFKNASFFAIYDGHSGKDSAELCSKLLHKNIIENSNFEQEKYKYEIIEAFKKTDKVIIKYLLNFKKDIRNYSNNSGSTAVTIFILDDILYLSNIGDSEAILISKNHSVEITEKHTPAMSSEKRRIQKAGGKKY